MVKSRTRGRGEPKPLTNNLKRILTEEGIYRANLAREADISEKTIERVEAGKGGRPTTLYRILNALNVLRNKSRNNIDYTFKQIFPNNKEQ
jgi:transcriptional regulator with XRE-family HTH domain